MTAPVLEHYADGDVIIQQGTVGDRMYLVQSGAARIYRADRGVETLLADAHAGEAFGEMALFDQRPRSASARAVGDTVVRVITLDEFMAMPCDPVIRGMMATLAKRLRSVDEAFERLSAREAPEREQLAALWEARDWIR